MADSLYPPHSRLFVACDKDTTEEELTEAFKPYGSIANVNLCRDRTTGKPKGIAFIQFDTTCEAAAAMEAMNGSHIGSCPRPVKVTVALTKDQSGSAGSSDASQFLRLFLVVPKTTTENDLRHYFSEFGAVDTVSIVKDRETKESKGYAYVKFKKFVDAARAYENCDRTYKVVFAKPKEQQQTSRASEYNSNPSYSSNSLVPFVAPVNACTHLDENPEGFTCLKAILSPDLIDDQIEWLFDIPPGLEFVRFFNEPSYPGYGTEYGRKVIAQYDSPGTAAYALRKLDGFEYPAGQRVMIKPDYQSISRRGGGDSEMARRGGGDGVVSRQRWGQSQTPSTVNDLMQQVESLTKSLSEATRLIRSAGINAPLNKAGAHVDAFRCSARLPPPQPLAPPNSVAEERLFMVCEPGLPPQDALWDVFGRFGNLMELYILNGKNCGYVKYSNKASAQRAMQTLNGQDLYRMRMKVMIAEPQREDRKRPRTSHD